MPNTGLGEEFWGNFYTLDQEKHCVASLLEEVRSTGLQYQLGTGDHAISVEQLRVNLLGIKTHLRRKGFRVPKNSDKHVACVWEPTVVRSCNSTNLMAALTQMEAAPDAVKRRYIRDIAGSRTASSRLPKRRFDAIEQEAHEACAPLSSPASFSAPLLAHLDRELSGRDVHEIDAQLARYCYAEAWRSQRSRAPSYARRLVNSTRHG
jgi:hypothetical protein